LQPLFNDADDFKDVFVAAEDSETKLLASVVSDDADVFSF
jgi:hypothetical protein